MTPSHDTAGWLNARDFGASGSEFAAQGRIIAGSNRIEVADIGDFMPGQWVTVSKCKNTYSGYVYDDKEPYSPWSRQDINGSRQALAGEVEFRGFTVSKEWQVFVLHFEATAPATFSWLAVDPACQPNHRRWQWQGRNLPLAEGWIPLQDGVEVRFKKRDWLPGQVVAFHARSRLLTRIETVEAGTLVLADPAGLTTEDSVVRHLDQYALQQAIDRAMAGKKSLLIPAGRYRLVDGLRLKNATIRIEGEHRDTTLLDLSEGTGTVFWLAGGRDVTVRNLSMLGHTGFNQLPWYAFMTATGYGFWPTANQQMEVKGCAAAYISGTERVLFEDLRVSRMAAEAFYSQGPGRPLAGAKETPYTKSITYHRCIVSDCAANAFNNNDFAENTSILHCHVENVHNFWEGANRFTRVIGNYVRHAHLGSHGNIFTRSKELQQLGSGQTIIADNVFEGGCFGQGLCINAPTQVIVSDNLFINYSNATAINVLAHARYVNIRGNIIDLTAVEGQIDRERAGIAVSASNAIIADNQIYVRGDADAKAGGILLANHAVNIQVHNNIIANCKYAIRQGVSKTIYTPETGAYEGERFTEHVEIEVREALAPGHFRVKDVPGAWDDGECAGWTMRWTLGTQAGKSAQIAHFLSEKLEIQIAPALPVAIGDRFVIMPKESGWSIRDNSIDRCPNGVT